MTINVWTSFSRLAMIVMISIAISIVAEQTRFSVLSTCSENTQPMLISGECQPLGSKGFTIHQLASQQYGNLGFSKTADCKNVFVPGTEWLSKVKSSKKCGCITSINDNQASQNPNECFSYVMLVANTPSSSSDSEPRSNQENAPETKSAGRQATQDNSDTRGKVEGILSTYIAGLGSGGDGGDGSN